MSEYCVIMAGGAGTRFWPVSRADQPKQFLDLTTKGKSFLRITFDRMRNLFPVENILVVSHHRYAQTVQQQLPDLKIANLLLEPYSRDTAPAVAYATFTLLSRDPEAVFITVPADLTLSDEAAFRSYVRQALDFAATGRALICIGAIPERPVISCGYIQVASTPKGKPVKVKTFTEAPPLHLAQRFVDSGEFLLDTGMMVAKASVVKSEMEKYATEVSDFWKGWDLETTYAGCPRISLSDALLDHTNNAWVLPAAFGWTAIEDWETLYRFLPSRDRRENALYTHGKTIVEGSRRNIVISSEKDKLIAVHGLDDFVIVDSGDVLMICPRKEAELSDFIARLGLPEFEKYR
jgi:mannose-1-phosphate guanylyltransferase